MKLRELKEKAANAAQSLTAEEIAVLQRVKENPYYLLDDYDIPEADLMPEEEVSKKYEQNLLDNLEKWGNGFKKEA